MGAVASTRPEMAPYSEISPDRMAWAAAAASVSGFGPPPSVEIQARIDQLVAAEVGENSPESFVCSRSAGRPSDHPAAVGDALDVWGGRARCC